MRRPSRGTPSRGGRSKCGFVPCATTDMMFRRSESPRERAVMRDVAADRSRGQCVHLHFPLADARQPAARGLRHMASAPGRGNLHAPPRGLQQPSSPAVARTSRTSPSRLSPGNLRLTPVGSAPRDRGDLIDKGDDEAAGERLAGARRRRGATASRCAGRVHGRVCARCALPMRLVRQLDMGRELVRTWPCKVAVGAARVARLGRGLRPGPIALMSGLAAA